MKTTKVSGRILHNFTLPAVVLILGACGVEAGNPDSKGGKPFRFFISPASYPDAGAVTATIEGVNLIQGDTVVSKSYQSQKLDLLSGNTQSAEDATLALSFELEDSQKELQRVELLLAKENPYLQVTLSSQAQPVRVVVLTENGEVARSLVFNGTTKAGSNLDVLVDVELRKSLKPVTSLQQAQLNLPADVLFVIQQKHSFLELAQTGSVGFTGFEAGSLVCVYSGQALPAASADACTGNGYKSQVISSKGTATIGSLVSGEYQAVNITRDNKVVELKKTTVVAGKKVVLSGN
ncbi:MAG: hypothetical protein EBR09_12115 [Proteobacteria bacterium]|nr:hypothetical protein [Pseudomonadota bacterium]